MKRQEPDGEMMATSRSAHILLADSEGSVCSALHLILSQEPDLYVVGEVATADQLLAQIESACPDLLLLAWGLPGRAPTALMAEMTRRWPNLLIVVLASRPETRTLALKAGAHAFVSKVDPPERLLEAIRGLLPADAASM